MKAIITLFTLMIVAQTSFAGDCTLITDRTPCPGKETETLKPYNGKNPTEDVKKADSEEACVKMGEKAAKIVRKGTLLNKSVSVKFDGKDLGKSFSDKSECK